MIRRIAIIGSGNLAEALALAVARSGRELVQLFARNPQRGPEVARMAGTTWTDDPAAIAEADLYIFAVSDRAVAELAATLPLPAGAIVAHTAGSVPLDALGRFARRAVIYPLQTFTKGRAVDFSQIPLFLETSTPELHAEVEEFARSLTRTVRRAGSAERARIHLAGVFACNFVNAMYAAGERMLADAGAEFDLLKPLIAETAAKAVGAASPASVQTGPAVRNDLATLDRHRAMLGSEPDLETIYDTISRYIWETSRKI